MSLAIVSLKWRAGSYPNLALDYPDVKTNGSGFHEGESRMDYLLPLRPVWMQS